MLQTVERRVLWLATSVVHAANARRPNSSGVKVGGHQASSASLVSVMTALWLDGLTSADRVSVKPHASPVLHALSFLLGDLDASYLPRLREFGGLQPYPSRTKDPDTPDYSTGSVGIGGDGSGMGGGGPAVRADALRRASRRPADLPAGRRRAGRGRDLGVRRGPDGAAARRGALGRGPQPPVAGPHRAGHRDQPVAGDVRRCRLAGPRSQVRPAPAVAVHSSRRGAAAHPHRHDGQRGVPVAAALPRC